MIEVDPVPSITSEAEYLSLIHDLGPWAPALAEIGQREGLAVEQAAMATCCKFPTFFLPPDHYLKLYLPWLEGHETHADEARALAIMGRDGDLGAPHLAASGSIGRQGRYLVMSRVPGVAVRDVRAEVAEATMVEVAAWAGRFLRRLHAIPLEATERQEGWRAFVARVAALRASAAGEMAQRGSLPPHLQAQVEAWLPAGAAFVGGEEEMVLVHGDLKPKHVFVERHGGELRPVGVIDFNSARIGHRMWDLCYGLGDLRDESAGVRSAFLRAAAFPGWGEAGFAARALAWAIIQRWDRAWIRPGLEAIASLDELAELAFGDPADQEVGA